MSQTYITKEVLIRNGACLNGIHWFKERYPEGAFLSTLIANADTPLDWLHWGYEHLSCAPEEEVALNNRLHIINSTSIFHSNDIKDSTFIANSSKITKSNYVFYSTNVTNSQNVNSSTNIVNSSNIFQSQRITSSADIILSSSVQESRNICGSSYILNSSNCISSATLTNCHFMRASAVSDDSMFCANVINVHNALFCVDITDIDQAQYMLFNKPLNEKQWQMIYNEALQYIQYSWNLIKPFAYHSAQVQKPDVNMNISTYYDAFPAEFWTWIRNLPNFSEDILYQLTFKHD